MEPYSERSVFVPGVPQTQGSTRIGRHGARHVIIHDKHTALMHWRRTIDNAVRPVFADIDPIDVPVSLGFLFVLPRPKKPRFAVPAVKPDLDKLIRAAQDGLADGGVLRDDSRVAVIHHAEKVYASEDQPPGVHLTVRW